MVSIILILFSSEIILVMKTSAPSLIGTLTNEVFLNIGSLPSCSVIVEINKRTALEPISIAAYLCCVIKLLLLLIFVYNTHIMHIENVFRETPSSCRHYPDLHLKYEPLH